MLWLPNRFLVAASRRPDRHRTSYPVDTGRNVGGMTPAQDLTVVTLDVSPDQEPGLLSGYSELTAAGERPEGLVRSELLRGQGGRWQIQTLWRDREAILQARRSGAQPPALVLAERVGAQHSHEVYSVEASL